MWLDCSQMHCHIVLFTTKGSTTTTAAAAPAEPEEDNNKSATTISRPINSDIKWHWSLLQLQLLDEPPWCTRSGSNYWLVKSKVSDLQNSIRDDCADGTQMITHIPFQKLDCFQPAGPVGTGRPWVLVSITMAIYEASASLWGEVT